MKKIWKKHKLLVLGVPCVLVIAAVIGVLFWQHKKQAEVNAHVETGNKFLSELDYEQAIASYTQALSVDENNKEASLGLAEAYDNSQMYAYAEAVYRGMLEKDALQADVYEKLAELYIRQNKLEEARQLLEDAVTKVEDETITQLYYVTRPEPPTASYDSGEYSDRIRVELFPSAEGQTIYYTLDGSEPTAESAAYEQPLILRNGVTTLKAMVVNTEGYQSDIAVIEYDVTIQDILVELEEPLIESIIRNKLNIPYGEPIYNDDIEQITEIYIVGNEIGSADDEHSVYLEEYQYSIDGYYYTLYGEGQISTLNDLRYMPFLEKVAVEFQTGLDISALASCSNLKELSLVGNSLNASDIRALSGLQQLEKLALGWNDLRDISALSGLTGLKELGVWGNRLTSIDPAGGLTELEYLDFSDNLVTDLSPVAGLSKLTQLWMYHNSISDISPVTSLSSLQVLMLRDNPVENPQEVKSIYPHLTRIDVDVLQLGGGEE